MMKDFSNEKKNLWIENYFYLLKRELPLGIFWGSLAMLEEILEEIVAWRFTTFWLKNLKEGLTWRIFKEKVRKPVESDSSKLGFGLRKKV